MKHFSDYVRCYGSPFEYSNNMYELHISLMKTAYMTSNRQDFTSLILKHNSRLHAYKHRMGELEPFETTTKRMTALDHVNFLLLNDLSQV
jgi:hypothetical protein